MCQPHNMTVNTRNYIADYLLCPVHMWYIYVEAARYVRLGRNNRSILSR